MKFVLGVIVGAFASRPLITAVDRQFGKTLRPQIADTLNSISRRIAK